jgi:hypothetical protein
MTGGHCGGGPSSLAQEEPYTLGEKDISTHMGNEKTGEQNREWTDRETNDTLAHTRQPWCCVSNHGVQPWLNSILITIKAGTCHLQCLHYAASMRPWNLAVASVY